jgi:hypothetical protein
MNNTTANKIHPMIARLAGRGWVKAAGFTTDFQAMRKGNTIIYFDRPRAKWSLVDDLGANIAKPAYSEYMFLHRKAGNGYVYNLLGEEAPKRDLSARTF